MDDAAEREVGKLYAYVLIQSVQDEQFVYKQLRCDKLDSFGATFGRTSHILPILLNPILHRLHFSPFSCLCVILAVDLAQHADSSTR